MLSKVLSKLSNGREFSNLHTRVIPRILLGEVMHIHMTMQEQMAVLFAPAYLGVLVMLSLITHSLLSGKKRTNG